MMEIPITQYPTPSRRTRAVHELIARRAARDPEAVAVTCGTAHLTYGELARRAHRLARRLRTLGVGPEVPVGLFVERSPAALVGLLGILEAGGVYLPLDTAHPGERLAFLIDDARLPVIVTRTGLAEALPPHRARLVDLEELDLEALGAEDGEEAGASNTLLDSLAYVIYTSGSTGRPKGTAVSHRAIARHCLGVARRLGLTPADRVLQFYGLSFDLSIEQMLPPLVAGARVVLRGDAGWSAAEFGRRVRELGLTVASLPPAYFGEVAREEAGAAERNEGDRLRLVTTGGERLELDRLALWRRGPWRAVPLLNGYGPTATTITATFYQVPPGSEAAGGRVPIGRPLPGRTAHLLDRDGGRVADGEAGEICLGGRGLARGYLGRPELTAERFVPDPFSSRPGARLYRTGDLAARLPAGDLDFQGRIDEQVKIRGFRVEPGEIEAALRAHPQVGEAAVIAREDRPGERRLVAYVVGTVPGAGLRRHLAARLPAYMVPAAFVPLERLPRTPGGKLDRRALPAPERRRPEIAAPYSAPRRALEERLAALWAELFEVDRVGVDDPFVELGGHSLLAIQLASRVRDTLGLDLPLHNPFAVPTVAELARIIEEGNIEDGEGARPAAAEVEANLAASRVPAARSAAALRRLLAAPLPRVIVSSRDLPGLIAETDSVTADTLLAQMATAHQGEKAQRPAGLSTPYEAPRDELEERLAAIWQDLFGIEPVGRGDSFLELGGHSLLAIQMVTQIRAVLEVELPVTALFESPTVAELGKAVRRARGEEDPAELEALLALIEGLSPEEAAERLAEMGA